MSTFSVAYTTAGPRVAQTDLLSGAPHRQVWEDRGGGLPGGRRPDWGLGRLPQAPRAQGQEEGQHRNGTKCQQPQLSRKKHQARGRKKNVTFEFQFPDASVNFTEQQIRDLFCALRKVRPNSVLVI